ncbi:MAG: hypothetical protein IMZ67_00240, partial [Acidobacteria bacterium]|nr:hypothetical protein [Acidobacteriota bacterium]
MGKSESRWIRIRSVVRVCQVVITGVLIGFLSASSARAQSAVPKPVPENTAYITPWWPTFLAAADDATVEVEVQKLRQLVPDRLFARSGFQVTIEVNIPNWAIDIHDQAQVDANLAATFSSIDRALARGQRLQVPLVLTIATVTRPFWRTDAAHGAAQAEDRRNVQWHWDNSVAADWWTYSRYARKEYEFFKIHVQTIGRYLARKVVEYPDVLIAASGDAEVELSLLRTDAVDPNYPGPYMIADYSPFALLEFRDWVRHTGMYDDVTGVYRGTGYGGIGGGYAGDPRPNTDGNLDDHTFNGDFGTSFTTWDLRYFHWDLSEPADPDPRAIPRLEYESADWNPIPGAGAAFIDGGFDAPRSFSYANYDEPFWQLWNQFRQTLVHRHNVEFAEWITTSADPSSGATFPAARWYSYQIPADHLFGLRPGDGFANPRLDSSASPIWTADVAPYGGAGITDFENTSAFAMPAARALSVNWGLLEYNPCQAGCPDLSSYLPDMALIKQHRPRIIAPFGWQLSISRVEDTPFIDALAGMMSDTAGIPLPSSSVEGYAPPQPQAVEAHSSSGAVTLQWSPRMWPSEALSAWNEWAGFNHFEVHRSPLPGFTPGPGTLVGTSTAATAADTSLVTPGQYCYQIIAVSR